MDHFEIDEEDFVNRSPLMPENADEPSLEFGGEPKVFGEPLATEFYSYVHQCNVCHKVFMSYKGLQQHAVIHTNLKPFGCDVCGKSFRFKSNLFEHRSVHLDNPGYVCPFCNKTCRLKGNLKKHLRTHVSTQEALDRAWQPFSSNRKPAAEIPDNAVLFRRSGARVKGCRRRKNGLGDSYETWVEKIKSGQILPRASITDKLDRMKSRMDELVRQNDEEVLFQQGTSVPFEKFDCPLCRSFFMSYSDCSFHIKNSHPNAERERPMFCAICLKSFIDIRSMEQHNSYHQRVRLLMGEFEAKEPPIVVPGMTTDIRAFMKQAEREIQERETQQTRQEIEDEEEGMEEEEE
ncbi:hypothetical protein L596_012093 [Steinernema carpocapsae]|uniref:C2H2-type domain-containing protein n=1 Tax=Steinernema carpocapsae TaxID=34508 RepID=A0A4U5NWT8_STECR|nr:hypothetical protein L596_012093 [Steinernema carpocapsae]